MIWSGITNTPGAKIAAYAADGRDGEHIFGAARVQCPDIGAVVDLVRRYGVAVAVARQKYDRVTGDAAERERTRRLAVRRAHHLAADRFEAGNLRKTAAADDR